MGRLPKNCSVRQQDSLSSHVCPSVDSMLATHLGQRTQHHGACAEPSYKHGQAQCADEARSPELRFQLPVRRRI